MENRAKKITVDMIVNQDFGSEMNGYNRELVDNFLNDICDYLEEMEKTPNNNFATSDNSELFKKDAEINRLQTLVRNSQNEVANLRAKLESTPSNDAMQVSEQATALLLNAQKVFDQTVSEANAKAKSIIDNAQGIADAQVSGLKEEKDALEFEIEELKDKFSKYLDRLDSVVEEQKNKLNDIRNSLKQE